MPDLLQLGWYQRENWSSVPKLRAPLQLLTVSEARISYFYAVVSRRMVLGYGSKTERKSVELGSLGHLTILIQVHL
jgi:hypothetical protein